MAATLVLSNKTDESDGVSLILRLTFNSTLGDKLSHEAKRLLLEARGRMPHEALQKRPLHSHEHCIASQVQHVDELQNPRGLLTPADLNQSACLFFALEASMFKIRHFLHLLTLIISVCCLLWLRSAHCYHDLECFNTASCQL